MLLSAAVAGGGGPPSRHEGIEDYEAEDVRNPFGDEDFGGIDEDEDEMSLTQMQVSRGQNPASLMQAFNPGVMPRQHATLQRPQNPGARLGGGMGG